MKLASKWIVIPYNSHVNKTENSLTSKEKIEKIVNNKNIVDIDKLNLINQIINKNITPPQIIAEHKKEETYPNFQFINDHIQTNENKQENNIEEEPKKKKKRKTSSKPAKNSKETEDLINKTFENIQHYLPPTAATRNQTSQFIVPVVHLDEITKKKKSKKRKIKEQDEEEEDVFQDANNEIVIGNGIKWTQYVKKKLTMK
jgi:hypothetical protein